MRFRVTLRVDPETGETQVQVDDISVGRRLADHDARHEELAQEFLDVLDPQADLDEIRRAAPLLPAAAPGPEEEAARTRRAEELGGAS
ncbi:hypothetical protein SAMN05421505_10832 [Sinosporangium album]|uniref:FtsH ternary system domain-containing protein n=1 Tax=Sinosporangium album TaxID=504805 RepID=A0A1G7X4B8_9ACTN|nr:hypothetical protein [Sinosporangium album]SDG79023.1 hypothetical protein SAMN05421505_10832 [Sinosporangium album]